MRRTLEATLDELARVGYASLRIEDVADRADVNKTTIYRRWPTKEALVRDALLSLAEGEDSFVVPDTGSLRGDLTVIIKRKLAFGRSPNGKAILRVVNEATPDDPLLAITRSLRANGEIVMLAVLERARARGTLRASVDTTLFVQLLQLACDRIRSNPTSASPRFVSGLVDLLVDGARTHPKSNSKLRKGSS